MISRRRLLAAAVSTPVVLAGCKVRTINYFPPTNARVRFVNVVYHGGAYDFLDGSTVVFSAIPFEGSVDYADFENTRRTFSIRETGFTEILSSVDISLAGDEAYTILGWRTGASPSLMVAPDVSNSVSGKVQMRLINAAFAGPNYDLYITAPDVALDGTFGPAFYNIAAGSSTTSVQQATGSYRLRATLAGTLAVTYDSGTVDFPVEGSTDILLYSLDSLQLPQGMILDVFGSDRRVVLTSSISAIRLMNAAPQSGQIYGLFDGTTFTAALDYTLRSGDGYQATGQHVITIEASSAPGATIATIERMFESARDVTIVVAGLPGAVQAFAVPDDNSPPPPDPARIRYVNAVSDNAAYDVFVGDTKQVSALAARTASIYFDVAPGTLVVTFRDPATGAVALTVPDVSLSNGSIRTIYATGTAGQMNSLPAIDR